jgi:hypothetical protein
MKLVRLSILAMFIMGAFYAQGQCNWNETVSGQITETCTGGKVGIGTNAPIADLHVKYSAPGQNQDGGSIVRIEAESAGLARLQWAADRIWSMGILPNVSGGTGKFALYDFNSGVTRLVVDPAAGIGLGTNSPYGGLHVFGAVQATATPVVTKTSKTQNAGTLFVQDSGTDTGSGGMVVFAAGQGPFAGIKGLLRNGTNETTGDLVFSLRNDVNATTLSERMRITSEGTVAIGGGTPDPSYKLQVTGNAYFTGTVTGGNIQAHYQDIAEWVPTTESLGAGTVVVLDSAHKNHVVASMRAYDQAVAGVVSAKPGVILGERSDAKAMIATTGRVRVHVDASREPIVIGDLLVTGDRPGTAMKSLPVEIGGVAIHRPGTIIGKALEPLAGGQGEILVLLSLQ